MQQRQGTTLNQSRMPRRREQVTPGPVRAASGIEVDLLSDDVDGIASDLAATDGRVDTAESRLAFAESDIDALQAALATAQDGHLRLGVRTVTANTAFAATDYLILVNAAAGAVVVTLPAVQNGRQVCVKRIDATANPVTISTPANIDGAASQAITPQYASLTVMCDGATWWII